MAKRFGPLVFLFIGCFIQATTARPAKNSGTLLQILPNTEEIIVQSGDDVTITCIGDQSLSWEYSTHAYSHPDELRHDIDNRLMIDSYQNDGTDYPTDYAYVSTVRILNATFLDTGYITCLNEDDQLARIYVYVRDPNHLWSIIPTPTASRVLDVVGGSRVTIPCRPTDPNIAVLLKESNVQVYPSRNHRWVAYDPREGFVIGSYPFRRDTEFECIAQLPRIGKTETFSFYVRVDENVGGVHIPPSIAREASEEVTFLGPDPESLPEASFQDMIPISVSELVAPEPVYEKKVPGELLDQSVIGYLQDSAEIYTHHFPTVEHPQVRNQVQDHSLDLERRYSTRDQHFPESFSPSPHPGGKFHGPNSLVSTVQVAEHNPDYVDYVLDGEESVSVTTPETHESSEPIYEREAEVAYDPPLPGLTSVDQDHASSTLPSDDLLSKDSVIVSEETSTVASVEEVEQTKAEAGTTEAAPTEAAVEVLAESSSEDEVIEDSTPQVELTEATTAEEDQSSTVSTTAKKADATDKHDDLLFGLEDLIVPDEEVDDFLKIQFSTTTERAETPELQPDNQEDPYDIEALESKIVKSVAFTVGSEGQSDTTVVFTTPQTPRVTSATTRHSAGSQVTTPRTVVSTTLRAVTFNPVQAGSRPSAREILTEGELISNGVKSCEHSSNGRKTPVECKCNTTIVQNVQESSSQNLVSESLSSPVRQSSAGSKTGALTLQPTVTKIGNGQTKIGGTVQFECTIVVSEDFDLVLEWSYPQSINKQKIHISPQTVTRNGNDMKTMRSVLTNRDFQRGDVGPYVCMPTLVSPKGPASLVGPRPSNGNGNGHTRTKPNGHQNGIQTILGPRPMIVEKTSGRKVVGGDFILECSAAHTKADTLLELLWKIPNQVEKSGRSSITPNSERNGRVYSTLTVKNLQLSDKGNYTCIAEEIHPENGLQLNGRGALTIS